MSNNDNGSGTRRTGRLLARLLPLAVPLDATENIALIRQLTGGAAELYARIASLAAVPKFALVAAAVLFLLAVLPALGVRRCARR